MIKQLVAKGAVINSTPHFRSYDQHVTNKVFIYGYDEADLTRLLDGWLKQGYREVGGRIVEEVAR